MARRESVGRRDKEVFADSQEVADGLRSTAPNYPPGDFGDYWAREGAEHIEGLYAAFLRSLRREENLRRKLSAIRVT